jgi:hypothetical protein
MSVGYAWYLSGPAVGENLLVTFLPATATIYLSAPTTIVGSVTVSFDTFLISSGLWTNHPTIISGSAINSATIVAASSISSVQVDGIRPNFAGAWSGHLKVCFCTA